MDIQKVPTKLHPNKKKFKNYPFLEFGENCSEIFQRVTIITTKGHKLNQHPHSRNPLTLTPPNHNQQSLEDQKVTFTFCNKSKTKPINKRLRAKEREIESQKCSFNLLVIEKKVTTTKKKQNKFSLSFSCDCCAKQNKNIK